MSYNTDLQNNNADLREILNAVNVLPEAGTGGGGAELNTCTVSFTGATEYITRCTYMRYQDGNVERVSIDGPVEMLDSVVAGTILVVRLGEGGLGGPFFDAVGDERVLATGSATRGSICVLSFDESGSIEVMLG